MADETRTVKVTVHYRVRVPADVPLTMLAINNRTVEPPPLEVGRYWEEESGKPRFTTTPVEVDFLTYSYGFEEEIGPERRR